MELCGEKQVDGIASRISLANCGNRGGSAINNQLFKLDLAAFTVQNNCRTGAG